MSLDVEYTRSNSTSERCFSSACAWCKIDYGEASCALTCTKWKNLPAAESDVCVSLLLVAEAFGEVLKRDLLSDTC